MAMYRGPWCGRPLLLHPCLNYRSRLLTAAFMHVWRFHLSMAKLRDQGFKQRTMQVRSSRTTRA